MKRRGSRLAHLAAVCGLAAACTRPPTPTSPDPGSDTATTPSTPIRHARGEVIDLTVPLLAGHALALAELRGRVVVLEITAASEPSWPASFATYNHLLRQHGSERLAVLVVSVDPERAVLSPEPDLRAHGFELGWDPQGALAARLQMAALPTILVLDRAGRLVHIAAGPHAADTLADAVHTALTTP